MTPVEMAAQTPDKWLTDALLLVGAVVNRQVDIEVEKVKAHNAFRDPPMLVDQWGALKRAQEALIAHLKLRPRNTGEPIAYGLFAHVRSRPAVPDGLMPGCVKPDTDKQVFFYEQDFYVLSNFSAFAIEFKGVLHPTSEQAYHWQKFPGNDPDHVHIRQKLLNARSAHDAFKLANDLKAERRTDWDRVKIPIMKDILRAKVAQHEYVCRKLLATGDRELIEDSWRDDYWGWGPNRDGKNMLGKLWMEVRAELIAASTKEASALSSKQEQSNG